MNQEANKKKYEKRKQLKAAGLCVACANPRNRSKVYCDKCLAKQSLRVKRWLQRHPLSPEKLAKMAIYQKAYREKKKERHHEA